MIVFKTLMRTTWRKKTALILPMIMFVAFMFVARADAQSQESAFTNAIPKISVVNLDNSNLSKGLLDYLDGRVEFVEATEAQFENLIFYHEISFAMTIPANFSETFQTESIQSQMIYDNASGYIADSYVNEYLNAVASLYNNGYSLDESIHMVQTSLVNANNVSVIDTVQDNSGVAERFFTLELYPDMLTVLTVVTMLLIIFNQTSIKMRSAISATSTRKQTLQLMFGIVLIGNVLWVVTKIITVIVLKDYLNPATLGLHFLNSYVFFIVILSLAFLISKFALSPSMRVAVLNSTTLGLSFISGVFVPQYLMNATIVNISKLFPLYWNIEVTQRINDGLTSFGDLAMPFLIQIVFAVVLVAVALVISSEKSFKTVNAKINTQS
ncbi:ABC transporter permease [Erysipelothrix sp. HDW6C]|uniref:ABC transporter permease n=1 Tax=Erysipelothrix sp. HDW6C TaxID=2714930 RepID=UPI001409147F|nr:ABC transporter permease [Erysipelothrix sp. HDW6C]QIK69619.1 ABC transporter permease [Erysipelothrix sp. HDW6C]